MEKQAVFQTPSQTPSSELLYLLCTCFTWALLAMNAIELFTGIAPSDHSLSTAYFAILAAYGGNREVRKWRKPELEQTESQRKGERFVVAWALFCAFAVVFGGLIRHLRFGQTVIELHFPHELMAITLETLTVLTGTKISKGYRLGTPLVPSGRRRARATP